MMRMCSYLYYSKITGGFRVFFWIFPRSFFSYACLRTSMGKAAAAGYRETVGIGRPTSDQGPAGHRGNDDGMSVNGDFNATRETHAVRGRTPQPDAREGQAGPHRVAERLVVPVKPG